MNAWFYRTIRAVHKAPQEMPAITGFRASEASHLHVVAGMTTLCKHRQKIPGRLKGILQTTDVREALAWGRPMCSECESKLPASVLQQFE